jgi:hypothetical protein
MTKFQEIVAKLLREVKKAAGPATDYKRDVAGRSA